MSDWMRATVSGSDGSQNSPFMQSGRYHKPGLASNATIFAQKVFMSIPKAGEGSSQGPKPESNFPVSFSTSGGE